ncbi:UNVERIFIED_CONTAM: Cation/H(+) antiporter 18 [Sesamum angustifolium]|uniref:Cation/H(+) antiporter 18 n=1 Tax=Sesamum angustifolium TaxID=2727405 RepID=A0AAW2IWS7_9LAMI
MSTMHEDICTSAETKRTAMIILPFHKHQRLDGQFETTRAELRHVNRKVLEHAPCSVGILVDRGLGGTAHVSASNVDYTITAIFFGGPDDREAVSYGALMAEHPGISLNIVRFIIDPKVVEESVQLDIDQYDPETRSNNEEFISEFKQKASKDGSITFKEVVVSNADEAVDEIQTHSRCNLFLVGRIPEGPIFLSVNKRSECPELGPIASMLMSPEFSTTASVLVVQQYRRQLTGDSLTSLREGETKEGESDSC